VTKRTERRFRPSANARKLTGSRGLPTARRLERSERSGSSRKLSLKPRESLKKRIRK
jgi:hypothetical protein